MWEEVRALLGRRFLVLRDEATWLGLAAVRDGAPQHIVVKLGEALGRPHLVIALGVGRADRVLAGDALAYNAGCQIGSLAVEEKLCSLRLLVPLDEAIPRTLEPLLDALITEAARLRCVVSRSTRADASEVFASFAD